MDGEVEVFRPEPVDSMRSVEIRGIRTSLVVHPGEVVVLTFPEGTPEDYLVSVRWILLDAGLRPDQIVLLGGNIGTSTQPRHPELEG